MLSIFALVVALVFAAVGVGLLIAARNTRRKLAAADAIATSSTGSVSSMQTGDAVEVTGTLRCESPLTSELAQESCAYFRAEVTREYEVQERNTSNNTTSWQRRSETLSANTHRSAFIVEDETGSVRVEPEGADIDANQVVNRLQPELNEGTIGGLAVSIGQSLGGQRNLGYRYSEHILRVGDPIYVLGVVRDDHAIGSAPSGVKDKQFVISHRSEEDLTSHWRKSAKTQQIWSYICLGIGAVVAVVALIIR